MQGILLFVTLTIVSVLGINSGSEWTETTSVALSTIVHGHNTGTGLNPSPTVPSLTGIPITPTQSDFTVITGPGGTPITVVTSPGGAPTSVPVTISVSTAPDGTETTVVVPIPGGTTTASVPVPSGSTTLTTPAASPTTGTTAGAASTSTSNSAALLGHGDVGMKLAVSGVISGSLALILGL